MWLDFENRFRTPKLVYKRRTKSNTILPNIQCFSSFFFSLYNVCILIGRIKTVNRIIILVMREKFFDIIYIEDA